jgi:hypothetical protein
MWQALEQKPAVVLQLHCAFIHIVYHKPCPQHWDLSSVPCIPAIGNLYVESWHPPPSLRQNVFPCSVINTPTILINTDKICHVPVMLLELASAIHMCLLYWRCRSVTLSCQYCTSPWNPVSLLEDFRFKIMSKMKIWRLGTLAHSILTMLWHMYSKQEQSLLLHSSHWTPFCSNFQHAQNKTKKSWFEGWL